MKIDKKNFLFYVVISVVIVLFQYEPSKFENYKLPLKAIIHLDETTFDMYKKKIDTEKEINKYWGYAKELDINETTDEIVLDINNTETLTLVEKPDGENVLCIENSCHRLIGIHYSNETPTITIYNKDLKTKVKDYEQKEILAYDIMVNKITTNRVEFMNISTEQIWSFKLFDVNRTKYKPKEMEE